MKKSLQNQNLINLLKRALFVLLPVYLLNTQNTFAQATPCATSIVYFLSTEGTTTDLALNGKIKLYGDVTGTHRIVVSNTLLAAPVGNTEFTGAALFSTFGGGYIKSNAPNTTQTYHVRVYAPDGSCYTDKSINFEKATFTTVPTQPDIMVAVTHNGGVFPAKNALFNAFVTIQNDGTATATGLEVTVVIPAGMTVVVPTASSGTYNAGTGKWTIASLTAGSNATLTFTNTSSTTEGVKFITANLTAEVQTDKDSSPTTNNFGEDDQDQACVSTPYELCLGNKVDITIANTNTNVVWRKNNVVITGSVAGQYSIVGNVLTIFSIGEYEYSSTSTVGTCGNTACCPIKVIPAPLPVLSLTPSPVLCFGGNTGSIAASATSGTTPYEFSKDGTTFQSSGAFPTLTAGTYTITVRDFGKCIATATTTVTQPAVLAVAVTPASPVICNGQSTSLTATATGGTLAYSYVWSPATGLSATTGATVTANPTTTTLYTVTATDGNGCIATTTANVTVNPLATITAANATICSGAAPAVAISSSVPATYTWTVGTNPGGITGASSGSGATIGQTLVNPSSTAAATIQYIITSSSTTGGCTTTAAVLVTVNPKPTVSLTNQVVCQNTALTLTPTVSNGSGFLWSTGATSSSISVPTGAVGTLNYTVTVTGTPGGCTATASASVTVNPQPTVSLANQTVCQNTSLTLTPTITSGSTFLWSTGATSSSIIVPTATAGTVNYTITVTGATGGCTATASANVTVNPLATITAANATICSGNAPAIAISSSVPATYTWTVGTNPGGITGASSGSGATIGQTLVNPSSTAAATIQYIITSSSTTGGCTTTAAVLVTVNPKPTVSLTNQVVCQNTALTLTPTVSNGSGFLWSTGATSSSISVPTGAVGTLNYTVTVTGTPGGCTATASASVTVNPQPTVSLANQTVCQNTSLTLTPTITSGSTFLWSTGATSSSIIVPTATAGTVNYTITVTGATGGCTATASANVTVNPLATITAANATICSGNAPAIAISSSVPATYTWTVGTNPGGITGASSGSGATIGQTLVNPSSTAAATIQYIITSSSTTGGCTTTAAVLVTVNPKPTVSLTNQVVCQNTALTLTPTVSNGSGFLWSTGATSSSISVPTGAVGTLNYTVTVTGTPGGCTATASASVTVNPQPTVSLANQTVCQNTSLTLTPTITSGSTFLWSTGATSSSIIVPTATAGTVNYTITVTGATGGCTATASANVTVNPLATITAANATICSGNAPAIAISSSVPATYTWTVGTNPGGITGASSGSGATIGQTLVNPSSTAAATIQYIITSSSTTGGCTTTAAVLVTVNPKPTVSLTNQVVCQNTALTLTPTVSNGSGFLWSTGATSSSISVPTGAVGTLNYTVTVTGTPGGCTATASASVTVNPQPTVSLANQTVCQNTALTLTPTITSGSTFLWSTGATSSSIIVPTATAGTVNYTITVTGATGGCTATASANVTVNPLATITAANATICSGNAPAIAISSSVPATYTWTVGTNPGGITGASSGSGATIGQTLVNPSSTAAATIQYIITSSSTTGGCTTTAAVLVTVNPKPTVSLTNQVVCQNTALTLTPTVSNGSGFLWSTGATSSSISVPTGAVGTLNYTVTVTGTPGGCTATASASVTVNPQPTVSLANQTVCQNTALTLTPTITSGSTFLWSTGATSSSIIVPTATAGTVNYTITVTGATGGCTATASANVTVNPLATITAANATICSGNAPAITISSSVPASYSWTIGAITGGITGASAGSGTSIAQVLVNPSNTASGTVQYIITASTTTGTCISTTAVLVTVNPKPTVTLSSPTICAGTTTTLTPTGLNSASTFIWSNGATTSTISVTPTETTLYSLTVSSGAGCTVSTSVWVEVNQLPTAEVTAITSSCLGAVSQGNGQLILNKYRSTDQVSYLTGSTYVAPPTATAFANVPVGGIFTVGNPLPNTATNYTVRVKNTTSSCYIDLTVPMAAITCPCPIGYCEPATIVKTK